jgi:hypothetical protein
MSSKSYRADSSSRIDSRVLSWKQSMPSDMTHFRQVNGTSPSHQNQIKAQKTRKEEF